MTSSLPIIAVFDFDHTLTDRDSLLPLLLKLKGKMAASYQLTLLGPSFAAFLLGNLSRQGIKEKILSRFIGGLTAAELHSLGEDYAAHQLGSYVKPEGLERLSWHQAQGHRCLLISASLEFYLKPWAELHGFEAVLASKLEFNAEGQATGRLLGLNCWGPEKVVRLIKYLGPEKKYQLYAYGDSRGDQELLAFADHSFYRTF